MYRYRYPSSPSMCSDEEEEEENGDQYVYEPDDSVAGRVNHPGRQTIDPRTGKVITVRRETPDDYCKLIIFMPSYFDYFIIKFTVYCLCLR
ncbi:unnamed protein product [Trichobilharzia regenti]|nr:unnamed protein product [Trichobilharzia regenti]